MPLRRKLSQDKSPRDLSNFPEQNPNPMLRADRDGRLLYANSAARKVPGLLTQGARQIAAHLGQAAKRAWRNKTAEKADFTSRQRIYNFNVVPVRGEGYVNLYGRDVTEARQAQQHARDLAKFPEENPSPVLRVGSSGAVLYANPGAKALTQFWQKGGRRLSPALTREVLAAYDSRKSRHFEVTAGTQYFVLMITPVPGADYVNLYGRNVTEERRAQQQTRDIAKFPEENPNPVLRVTPRGDVLYANSAARELRRLLRNGHRKLDPEIAKFVVQAHAKSETVTAEFATGGLLFALALTPVPGQDYVNLYGRDITEERRANLEVLRVKNFNQNILDNLSNGILTFDAALRLTSANPAARTLFSLADEAISGLSAAKLAGLQNAWLLQAMKQARTASAATVWMDKDIVGHGGRRSSANVTIVPLREDEASEPGVMLVLEDITREKRVKGTMVRFMSDNVVERLLEVDEAVLSGTSQEVTVLFSDIRQFARLSEKLGAQRMVRVLNAYFSDMVDIIFENGGTLDKFIGDAIMAVFGAPFVSNEDTENALTAAVEMVRQLRNFNAARQREGMLPIDIGVGIDTGPVIAGTIGSPKRMDYTVIGEHVNLAARIEAVNKTYGTRILISHHTKAKLKGDYTLREIDRVQVAGIEAPVQIFEALDYHTEGTFPNMAEALEAYAAGLAHYRKRDWSAAAGAFAEALNANPSDRPTQILLSRCWSLKARPPGKSWTGVTNLAG